MFSIGFIIVVVIIVVIPLILFSLVPVGLWISTPAAGVRIGIGTLVEMRLRQVSPREVIAPLIRAHKAGLDLTTNQLKPHYLAGGSVGRIADASIAVQRTDIDLSFERSTAIDLTGRDVLEAVQMSVNPKVIETPFIVGVAMNGIEVEAEACITVCANIARLVGGTDEETIIAKVGEDIIPTIGSSEHHTEVLENSDSISKTVLSKGLDSGATFEILSIDIADVGASKNIGADLRTEQALADKNIAQTKAEERRTVTVASEQEMKARVQEMRAKVVEAESGMSLAMAEALRSDNVGVKNCYSLKNIGADTGMRNIINKRTDQNDNESPQQ